jgi:hypothetical protein
MPGTTEEEMEGTVLVFLSGIGKDLSQWWWVSLTEWRF